MSEPALDNQGGLTRLRIDLAYDGTEFSGWARQPGRRTVQGVLEEALDRVLRVPVQLTVAGRTDAGVHATGQVAHVDVPAESWDDTLLRRLAGVLPPDVRVRRISEAPTGFDARFSALWRRYEYALCDVESAQDPLRRRAVVWTKRKLNDWAMQAAAAGLLGEHDFAAFCRHREGATTVRVLEQLTVERVHDEIVCTVQADAFCHSMVRSLVGALIAVGEGRQPVDWPAALVTRRERANEVTVAPAHGLTLVHVEYPRPAELAARAEVTRQRRQLADGYQT